MIRIIRSRASTQQMSEMMQMLETYVKLAVDIERGIVAAAALCTPTAKPSC